MAVRQMPVRPMTAKAADEGPVTRAVQDVTGAVEALTVGAVHVARNTLTAAVETVEDVGGRIGSLAVTTVRGATKAVSDIGGDLGELAKGAVQGSLKAAREISGQLSDATQKSAAAAIDAVEEVGGDVGDLSRRTVKSTVQATREVGSDVGSLAVDAVEGAVLAVDRIGSAAGRTLRDAFAGTVDGVKTVLAEVGVAAPASRRPLARASEPERRPLARVTQIDAVRIDSQVRRRRPERTRRVVRPPSGAWHGARAAGPDVRARVADVAKPDHGLGDLLPIGGHRGAGRARVLRLFALDRAGRLAVASWQGGYPAGAGVLRCVRRACGMRTASPRSSRIASDPTWSPRRSPTMPERLPSAA